MTVTIQPPDKEENNHLHHVTLEMEIIQGKYATQLRVVKWACLQGETSCKAEVPILPNIKQ